MTIAAVHHVGFTVSDLDRSCAWYAMLLETEPALRRSWDHEYVGRVVGYPGVQLEAALWDLPGGMTLELLQYRDPGPGTVDMESFNTGNAHLCLVVDDLAEEFRRLAGLADFRSDAPVDIPWGHFRGGRSCYLRDPDGISIELVQLPPSGPRDMD